MCNTPLAPHEPVCSTAFADATWSSSHRASHAQGSSPFPGPRDSTTTESAHLELPGAGIPVIVSFSAPYEDGGRAAWSTATVWANSEISVPNGIPSISEGSGLVYGAGQRDGQWGLEGLDFETGESRLWVEAGPGTCRPEQLMILSILPGVADVLEVVPDSCENSFYAATTIGPDGIVYQATLNGMSRYVQASVEAPPAGGQAAVGVRFLRGRLRHHRSIDGWR